MPAAIYSYTLAHSWRAREYDFVQVDAQRSEVCIAKPCAAQVNLPVVPVSGPQLNARSCLLFGQLSTLCGVHSFNGPSKIEPEQFTLKLTDKLASSFSYPLQSTALFGPTTAFIKANFHTLPGPEFPSHSPICVHAGWILHESSDAIESQAPVSEDPFLYFNTTSERSP